MQEGGMKRMQEDDLLDSQLLPYFPCVFFSLSKAKNL